ncbi:D(2) dopamine receptor [Saguinus oedipus]|uniref:D(2) dopamine receptor n=1 Tax=Saguinus oedipus TaxID=9490 RepID=A0ABQ9UQX3_SAGOE|nr:D(2) dopamine receptor [Saguinus oedipus]
MDPLNLSWYDDDLERQNWSRPFNGSDGKADRPHYNYYATLLTLLIIVIVFGNVLVCMAVSREKALQTTTNYLIVSLAVADLLVATLVMPWVVYLEATSRGGSSDEEARLVESEAPPGPGTPKDLLRLLVTGGISPCHDVLTTTHCPLSKTCFCPPGVSLLFHFQQCQKAPNNLPCQHLSGLGLDSPVQEEVVGEWKFSRIHCDIFVTLDVMMCTASILNLCAISIDRYTAVAMPMLYNTRYSSKRRVTVMIAIVWVLSFTISCPLLFGLNNTDQNECIIANPAFVVYSSIVSFYVPFIVTLLVYIKIYIVLRRRRKRVNTKRSSRAFRAHLRAPLKVSRPLPPTPSVPTLTITKRAHPVLGSL